MNGKTALIRSVLSNTRQTVVLQNYLVTAVSAGAARDGHAQVSIQVGSSSLAVPYLDSYTSPTVGDMVMVVSISGSPIIIGRVIGLPTF